MKSIHGLALMVSTAVLTGCPLDPVATKCSGDNECPGGYHCVGGVCTRYDSGTTADAGASDAATGDGSARDATPAVCQGAECPTNTHCVDLHDGGYQCWCGDAGECAATQECAQQILSDGGRTEVYQCCPTGQSLCGIACVNTEINGSHCGSCFNACSTWHCSEGRCVCTEVNQCQGEPEALNTIPRCKTDGGYLTTGDAGGQSGQCVYECRDGYADCDAGAPGCQTNVLTDPDNCGTCGRSALIRYDQIHDAGRFDAAGRDVKAIPFVSSHCVNGEPACGDGGVCETGLCAVPPTGSAGEAQCFDCTATLHCHAWRGAETFCCHGECIGTGQIDMHCGCQQSPFSVIEGVDCTTFDMTETSVNPIAGKVCINPDGGANITRWTVPIGRCGCNADGEAQCGHLIYNSNALGSGAVLYGLCTKDLVADPAKRWSCVTQSVSSCGMLNGVWLPNEYPSGAAMHGYSCDPLVGGPICEDDQGDTTSISDFLFDGRGECGCGTWTKTGDTDDACKIPVMGSDTRLHVIANRCGDNSSICYCESNNYASCNPYISLNPLPDCCGTYGCTNLSNDKFNCGTCEAACEQSDDSQSTIEADCSVGQCFCNSNNSFESNLAQCPTNGGGGGQYCDFEAHKCVCETNSNDPCPIGTYCLNGSPSNGEGYGCCSNNEQNSLKRCYSDYPDCTSDAPVLCVHPGSTNKKVCCSAASRCSLSFNNQLVCLESVQ
ncbi:MAG: hypothetical protein JXR83_06075 [Deltaproteobacteria bacterium]|nr:hypothetical protein [Deltaproteobacteria bacterium]